jgi:hypothetical protein
LKNKPIFTQRTKRKDKAFAPVLKKKLSTARQLKFIEDEISQEPNSISQLASPKYTKHGKSIHMLATSKEWTRKNLQGKISARSAQSWIIY